MSQTKRMLAELRRSQYSRMAFVAMVTSILLFAGLGIGIQYTRADDDDKKIRATGTFSSVTNIPPGPVAERTLGNLKITTRQVVTTFSGDLEGWAVRLETITEDLTTHLVYATSIDTFKGKLGDREGTFSFTAHLTGDRSACFTPVPPGDPAPCTPASPYKITFGINWVVVEGSGRGDLEGICGGGTSEGTTPPSFSNYDFTFRLGKSCKAND